MTVHVSCVVEGHGDVEAVPILVRRIADSLGARTPIDIPPPIRTPKSRLIKPGELERAVELAARQLRGAGAVLVLIDSDEDCPGELGPKLLDRARRARGDLYVAVVLAQREFETWFIAAAASIAGRQGLSARLEAPAQPETIRGAKEWLTQHMEHGRGYSPTVDQPILARIFDLRLALQVPSFEKLHREVARIIALPAPEHQNHR